MHADALYRDRKISAENELLREQLEAFDGSTPTKMLDPAKIHTSKWANRDELSYQSKEFARLQSEIESAGGNIQPIKVRPLSGKQGEYEIVFGHRRHRACLILGLPVSALIENLSDTDLFSQMDRENRQRADLRPYEQGLMYSQALSEGLFPSMRKMAEALGIEAGNASKVVSLVKLPSDVLKAFLSPLDLQTNWAPVLTRALQENPEYVLDKAKVLYGTTPRLKAAEVFRQLTSRPSDDQPGNSKSEPVIVKGQEGQSGEISFDAKKQTFTVNLFGVDASRLQSLEALVKAFLVRTNSGSD